MQSSDTLILPSLAAHLGVIESLTAPIWQGCLEAHLNVMLVLCTFTMLIELGIFVCSSRGSILDTAARRPVIPMLYVHLAVSTGEVAWTSATAMLLLSPLPICQDEPAAAGGRALIALARGQVWAIIALLAAPTVGLLCSFDLCGINAAAAAASGGDGAQERLGRRLARHAGCLLALPPSCWCPCGGGERRRGAVRAFAESIACLFAGLDLVPSDVVAGLLLLRAQQVPPARPQNCCTSSAPRLQLQRGRSSPAGCRRRRPSLPPCLCHRRARAPRACAPVRACRCVRARGTCAPVRARALSSALLRHAMAPNPRAEREEEREREREIERGRDRERDR